MNSTPGLQNREVQAVHPGVYANPHGGHIVHVKLDDRASPVLSNAAITDELAPADTPTLAGMTVFEDCVAVALQDGHTILLHAGDPQMKGSVLRFYHADGTLWRVVALEQLNSGWVSSRYVFRSDLRKLDQRLARIRSHPARPAHNDHPTLWGTGGWTGGVVYTATPLVWRIQAWQHSPLTTSAVAVPDESQVQSLEEYPPDVQMLLTLQEEGVQKTTYQLGGLALALTYVERIGLAAVVNRYCPRVGDLSEGTVMTVLVINRLLAPCPLDRVAKWVEDTGLHLLLGIPDPRLLNYHRLADTLQAVFHHWQVIAAEVTLNAVQQFGLKVETVHYDLTSVCFCGVYNGSSWVEFGYSRDHRPDLKQINIGLSTTADGEVTLPGGSGIHSGSTNDATTTVPNYQKLQALCERSDILVTGDRIMQSAGNMLAIARAHGRFLGPVDWTPKLRRVVAACSDDEFQELPATSARRGYAVKAIFRRVWFKHKEPLSETARKRLKQWRKRHHMRGRTPQSREVHFWMRAAIILDTARQAADARRRERLLQAYEAQLAYTQEHLGKGHFYGDPEWLAHHLADLECRYKDVRDLVRVTFTHEDGQMKLSCHRLPERIAKASRLDGKWVLVTNQPLEREQTPVAYMDWMVGVYHNHRHVERRMRNLKSNLPIRPLYVHRDDEVVALCFVSLLSLTVYTLIERDVQADSALASEGLRTTDALLSAMSGWGLSAFCTPSGYQVFWFDALIPVQQLIMHRLRLIDPGTRVPHVRLSAHSGDWTMPGEVSSSFLLHLLALPVHTSSLQLPYAGGSRVTLAADWAFSAIVNVLLSLCSLCNADYQIDHWSFFPRSWRALATTRSKYQ
jgi:transposase